jgi:ankyrin repeat protein
MISATLIFTFVMSVQVQRNVNMDIWVGAKEGDVNAVKALIRRGIDINAEDKDGDTALMIAAYYGHAGVVKALLDAGADANKKHRYGGTALMSAAFKGHIEIVKLLLIHGTEVNARTYDGSTALMLAVTNREESALDIIEMLLAHGADLNQKDDQGLTALMHAVSGPPPPPSPPPGYSANLKHDAQIEIVKTLLARGADPNAMAVDRSTPLRIAEHFRQTSLVDLLKRAGARQ